MGDEFRGIGEYGSNFTRMPIEDHYDFPPDEGSILVPFRDLPENWDSAPDVASLNFLDRGFIFPGEQFHILVHVSAEDTAGPEILTPFKVAAAMNKLAAKNAKEQSSSEGAAKEKADQEGEEEEAGSGEIEMRNIEERSIEAVKASEGRQLKFLKPHEEDPDSSSTSELSPSPTTLLQREGNRKRSLGALENFRKSHYYARIRGKDDHPLWQKRVVGSANANDVPVSRVEGKAAQDGHSNSSTKPNSHGCTPVLMEAGKFDPHSAGGVARNALACSVLGNGDIVVLLEVTMASESIADDAVMDVLQFERYESLVLGEHSRHHQQQQVRAGGLDPTEGLLQWLLPLDRPSSPPPSFAGTIHSSPPKPNLAPTNSNLFSFPLRSSSTGGSGSLQASQQPGAVPVPIPPPVPPPTYAPPPMYGSKVWDSAMQERSSKTEIGSEGLLSFRGAVLEPQRFSAHHGLEGLHVPGKRWSRKLSVVQPIKLESYSAHCNAQDLICVLVENVLPSDEKTADVVIYVDSVNVVCQSTAPGSLPVPVPISCVEVGDDQQLPGLPLRVGEQHSFILRPVTPASKLSPLNDTKGGRTGPGPGLGLGQELPPLDGSSFSRKKMNKDTSSSSPVGAQYAVIVSCHCSHTESRLHYKHPLQWRPRVPRDLLVSVSVETPSPDESTSELQPVFKSQVVTVQTTNLTSKDMNLTLLAPSSLANSPLSMVSFPAPLTDSPITDAYSQQHSFTSNDANSDGSGQESGATSPAIDHSMSMQRSELSPLLPPVQSIESVIGVSPVLLRERKISAADIVADNSPARTHLWLQSTIPLGCVPAHSTTAVKCDILPLVNGIITLDTLHISKNERDALYIPESPLQMYTTSSIATGVA